LICPNTGSTEVFRRAYVSRPFFVRSLRCMRCFGVALFGIGPRGDGGRSPCFIFSVAT
jgi:hypothetical protein